MKRINPSVADQLSNALSMAHRLMDDLQGGPPACPAEVQYLREVQASTDDLRRKVADVLAENEPANEFARDLHVLAGGHS